MTGLDDFNISPIPLKDPMSTLLLTNITGQKANQSPTDFSFHQGSVPFTKHLGSSHQVQYRYGKPLASTYKQAKVVFDRVPYFNPPSTEDTLF